MNEYPKIKILKVDKKGERTIDHVEIPSEHILEFILNYQEILEITCLDSHLEEFVSGFLFNEGIIKDLSDIVRIEFSNDRKKVFVDTKDNFTSEDYKKNIIRILTGCHGAITRGKAQRIIRDYTQKIPISKENIFDLLKVVEEQSIGHKKTRCIHTACLFDPSGKLLFTTEDLGRHNAVDKVVGFALKNNEIDKPNQVFVTGRISSEMVTKILATKWVSILSISSPTHDAVRLCKEFNIFLAARIKAKTMAVYNEPGFVELI
jgi:FdhD protein